MNRTRLEIKKTISHRNGLKDLQIRIHYKKIMIQALQFILESVEMKKGKWTVWRRNFPLSRRTVEEQETTSLFIDIYLP